MNIVREVHVVLQYVHHNHTPDVYAIFRLVAAAVVPLRSERRLSPRRRPVLPTTTLPEHKEDAPRMSDLAVSLAWSQSRLSRVMAWLEKSGWVRRIPSQADKRSNLAQLTAKGRKKLAEAAPGHVAEVRHLVIDALTGEQQRTLAQISEAITARRRSDPPTLRNAAHSITK